MVTTSIVTKILFEKKNKKSIFFTCFNIFWNKLAVPLLSNTILLHVKDIY